MNKKNLIVAVITLLFIMTLCLSHPGFGQQVIRQKDNQIKALKKPLILKPIYRFEVQGIKRILTTPTNVRFQVQYYISPSYPKPCFIGAYVPNKAGANHSFGYKPAGRLPNGVPKGQKHFTDNIVVELVYSGSTAYTSNSLEVVIYDQQGTKKQQIINWGQKWGVTPPASPPDLIIHSVTVSKYSPYKKTLFTVRVKNIGGTATNSSLLNFWLYKLNANGTLPATPNEYGEGYVPPSGTIAPGEIKIWTYEKSEFMVEGNWRVRTKINHLKTAVESNYNNNEKIYNFTIPN